MSLKQWSIAAALALSTLTAAHAQSFEELLRGIATDVIRGALQQPQSQPQPPQPQQAPPDSPQGLPSQPMGAVETGPITAQRAEAILLEHGLVRREAGARVVEAPTRGFWMRGNPNQTREAPILISFDGRTMISIGSNAVIAMELLPGGRSRLLTDSEKSALLRSMLANLKPGALIAFGAADERSPILISAPNCPWCVRLDNVARPLRDLNMRLMPVLLNNRSLAYSRVMCSQSPRQTFDSMIDNRGRVMPPSVSGCDKRLDYMLVDELIWAVSDDASRRGTVPTLLAADGRIMDLQFDTPAALRASIANATLR